ncbi:carbohydrate ABC transporter permease [Fodinicola feengrottensis]|uniref:Carbohydrate ABC transporter permease n=1 Tax=Fodinicola feengrottensis TaxID=435914 RepID=A0ABN2J0U0_9ACTN|nr:carbohydrate ABC transporter permease [Fodinicola feengrottensis]
MTLRLPTRSDTPTLTTDHSGQSKRPRPIGGGLTIASHGFLVIWAVMVTVPLLWSVLSALKSDPEIFTSPWTLPARWRFENFVRAWDQANIGSYFVNSVIVVLGGVALTLLLSSMVAYVLARFSFPGNRVVYYIFVGGMLFPVFLALVPLFFVVKNLGLLNTYQGLILVYATQSMSFSIFFLCAFFRTQPSTLVEAALLDGCSHWGAFFRVMLPLAKPGLISIGIFNFLGMWNEYLLPLVLTTDPNKFVIAQGLANLSVNRGYRSDFSGLFAGLVISMVPVLLVYVIFQRRITEGMTAGALR